MTKKSLKEAAAAGTSVFDRIASGNAQNTTDTQGALYVQDAKDVQNAPPKADKVSMERLNLKIPAELKEYLNVAAAKVSIEQRRNVSLTEYLCALVRADMEKNNE